MTIPNDYSEKLRSLYASYFDGWRRLFGVPPGEAASSSTEQREQRWEGEGGRTADEAQADATRTRVRG